MFCWMENGSCYSLLVPIYITYTSISKWMYTSMLLYLIQFKYVFLFSCIYFRNGWINYLLLFHIRMYNLYTSRDFYYDYYYYYNSFIIIIIVIIIIAIIIIIITIIYIIIFCWYPYFRIIKYVLIAIGTVLKVLEYSTIYYSIFYNILIYFIILTVLFLHI